MIDYDSLLRRLHDLTEPVFPRRTPESVVSEMDRLTDDAKRALSGELPNDLRAVKLYDYFVAEGYCLCRSAGRRSPASSFPTEVLFEKNGNCLGSGLLFLIVGWKLGLPVYGGISLGHFFPAIWDGKRYWRPEWYWPRRTVFASVYRARSTAELESYSRAAIVPLNTAQMEADVLVARAVTCRVALGDTQGARSDLLNALELWPDHPLARRNLELCLCEGLADSSTHAWGRL